MSRQTYKPASKQEKSTEITRVQEQFDAAMISGPPASELPENAVASLYNVVAFKKWLQGRYGNRIFSDSCSVSYPEELSWPVAFPGDRGRDGLDGTKVGNIITSTDANFTDDDIGNYFVWGDGYNDLIEDVLSSTQAQVRDDIAKGPTSEGFIRGKHNDWHFHKGLKKVVVQVGREF